MHQVQRQTGRHGGRQSQLKTECDSGLIALLLQIDREPGQDHFGRQLGNLKGIAQARAGGQQGFKFGQGFKRKGVPKDKREMLVW